MVVSEEPYYHEVYEDPLIGGLLVGKLGASRYILDRVTRKPITQGYHSFYMQLGTLMGRSGASKSIVDYNPAILDQS